MNPALECKRQADECRSMAKIAIEEQRLLLLEMADKWDSLARGLGGAQGEHVPLRSLPAQKPGG